MSDAPTPKTKTTKTVPTASATPVTVTSVFSGIPMPEIKRAGSKSIYNFDGLEVGQCFGVVGKTKRQIANSISNANKKFKATDGTVMRKFAAFDVDDVLRGAIADKPELAGATVLVFRTA